MSLINDALKRAKQAQQEAAPPSPSNLELRPIEPRQYTRPGVSMAIPALLAIASVVLLILLWQTARNASPVTLEVNARTRSDAASPKSTRPEPPPAQATPAPTAAAPASSASPATPVVASQAPAAASSATNLPPLVVSEPETTNPVAPVVTAPPKAVLPRLQAIVYHPTRPSVMINGRTLFVGDKLGEFRVRAIDQESVTLIGSGQTNVLTLPE